MHKKTHIAAAGLAAILVTIVASGCFSSGPEKKTYADCDKLTNPEEKGTCYYEVISDKKEFEKCDTIAHLKSKNMCYSTYAQDKIDESICAKITGDDAVKNSCAQSVQAKKPFTDDACAKLIGGAEKDSCYMYAGQDRKDSSLCKKIEDKNMRENCLNSVKSMAE